MLACLFAGTSAVGLVLLLAVVSAVVLAEVSVLQLVQVMIVVSAVMAFFEMA